MPIDSISPAASTANLNNRTNTEARQNQAAEQERQRTPEERPIDRDQARETAVNAVERRQQAANVERFIEASDNANETEEANVGLFNDIEDIQNIARAARVNQLAETLDGLDPDRQQNILDNLIERRQQRPEPPNVQPIDEIV